MRRGIRRTIVLFALAGGALLIAIVTIFIGTWPYERPSIALEPGGEDASFDGVGQLITDASLRGLQVGDEMCSQSERGHRPRDTDRHGARRNSDPNWHCRGNWRTDFGSCTRSTLVAAISMRRSVLWSPMTRHFKRTLDFDAPGSDRATSFAYQRASLNGALKTELVNDCLSDARRPHSRCDEAGGMPRAGWHTCCGSALRSDECRTG